MLTKVKYFSCILHEENQFWEIMKKFIAVAVVGLFVTALVSCGNGRHSCPAYGQASPNSVDVEVAE